MSPSRRRPDAGFTLIELLVVVSLAAIVLTLAAPAFYDFILMQRLKGINAQLVTDLQLARSEAVSRNTFGRVVFANGTSTSGVPVTCYVIYTNRAGSSTGLRCNCLLDPGSACTNSNSTEVRTVQVPTSSGVRISIPSGDPALAFDHVTGGLVAIPSDTSAVPIDNFRIDTGIDTARTLRTTLIRSGRPSVCGVSANLGAPTC